MRKQVFTTEKLHVNVLYIPEEYLSVTLHIYWAVRRLIL